MACLFQKILWTFIKYKAKAFCTWNRTSGGENLSFLPQMVSRESKSKSPSSSLCSSEAAVAVASVGLRRRYPPEHLQGQKKSLIFLLLRPGNHALVSCSRKLVVSHASLCAFLASAFDLKGKRKKGGNRQGSAHSPSSSSLLWMEKEEVRKEGGRRKASLSLLLFLFSSKLEKSEIAPLGNARPVVVLHSPRIFITEQTNFCLK